MEIEDRLKRLRDRCEKEGYEFFFGEVNGFTEESSGLYTCFIAGECVTTEDGMTAVIEAAEEYLEIVNEEDC